MVTSMQEFPELPPAMDTTESGREYCPGEKKTNLYKYIYIKKKIYIFEKANENSTIANTRHEPCDTISDP